MVKIVYIGTLKDAACRKSLNLPLTLGLFKKVLERTGMKSE